MAENNSVSAAQADFLQRFLGGETKKAATPKQVSLVTLQKARLLYSKTLAHVQSQLKALEAAIIKAFKDEPDAAEKSRNAKVVYSVLGCVDMRLIDQFDVALNAQEATDRAKELAKCARLIDSYVKSLNANPIFGILDDNPIHPVSVQKTLEKSLTTLRAQLV